MGSGERKAIEIAVYRIGANDYKTEKTALIADVHADANSGNVLEETVGYVDQIVVAYKLPDGRILVAAGINQHGQIQFYSIFPAP